MTAPIDDGLMDPSLLIIDDQEANVRLLARILSVAGYENITTTTDPSRVAELYDLCKPDIVLLDLHMPTLDGFAVLELLAPFTRGIQRLPVVMITGDDSADVKRKALALGAKDFISKPFDPGEIILRIQNLLETQFLHHQLRRQNSELEQKVAARTKQLEESQVEMLDRLAAAVEFRDDATGDHTKRVGLLSAGLAEAIGLGAATSHLIERAAPLHDIGKVGIPDSILLKPGPLTREEREIMESHTIIGSRMLSNGRTDLVRLCERIARSHHEKWDGTGYPDALAGQAIPLESRIVAVADVFDALTHDRPYRRACTISDTLEQMAVENGSHFDPEVMGALARIDQEAGLERGFI